MRYSRDMIGYGAHARSPMASNARIAVQIVMNYEGGETASNMAMPPPSVPCRKSSAPSPGPEAHWNMGSIYDYGARAKLLAATGCSGTSRSPSTASPPRLSARGNRSPPYGPPAEIATHGLKWIDYRDIPLARRGPSISPARSRYVPPSPGEHTRLYQGRTSMNTVALGCEEGGFEYLADTIADDLPYWHVHNGRPQLMVPYTMDANDMRFPAVRAFGTGVEFFDYLRDSFDVLYAEGVANAKMMSIGLHCRLAGRPGRAIAVQKFIEHARAHDGVWFATWLDIARHWAKPIPIGPASARRRWIATPSCKIRQHLEHSPWIAERVWDGEMGAIHDTPRAALRMAQVFRSASDAERLGVLLAHPDLAGKLAAAKRLTADSTAEQASAGLDSLTDAGGPSSTA